MSFSKLRGAIREKFGTQEAFAKAMGKSNSTISSKLNGKTEWDRGEIEAACRLLDIPIVDAPAYFFAI